MLDVTRTPLSRSKGQLAGGGGILRLPLVQLVNKASPQKRGQGPEAGVGVCVIHKV